jgi:hypothetical protein
LCEVEVRGGDLADRGGDIVRFSDRVCDRGGEAIARDLEIRPRRLPGGPRIG